MVPLNNFNFNNNIPNMQFNNNLPIPMMQQPQMFNNMNNNMMDNNNMMMNNNMIPNLPIVNGIISQQKKQEKYKLNTIQKIESLIPLNKCQDKYNDNEYDIITKICSTAVNDKVNNITNFCVEKIKDKLKGQWFVLIQDSKDLNFEFGFSQKIHLKDIIIFRYHDKTFYVHCLNK